LTAPAAAKTLTQEIKSEATQPAAPPVIERTVVVDPEQTKGVDVPLDPQVQHGFQPPAPERADNNNREKKKFNL